MRNVRALLIIVSGAVSLAPAAPLPTDQEYRAAAIAAAVAHEPSRPVWRATKVSIMPPMDNYPPHYRVDFEAVAVNDRLSKYDSQDCVLRGGETSWSCRPIRDQWLVAPPTARVPRCTAQFDIGRTNLSTDLVVDLVDHVLKPRTLRRLSRSNCYTGDICGLRGASRLPDGRLSISLPRTVGCAELILFRQDCRGPRCGFVFDECATICA
jgi:hypothetical protein